VRFRKEGNNGKSKLWTYLVPIAVLLFKVGCRIEGRVRVIVTSPQLRELSSITVLTYTTLSSVVGCILAIQFDFDSYLIGINTHASRCMVNTPHLFKDLKLREVGEVEGIKLGLDIKGTGTFKFKIEDNNGMTHKIKIPNSFYVPALKRHLLSPQHWVQEAKDNYPRPKGTRMEQDGEYYFLNWGQAKHRKPVPYNPLSNVPIMYMASSLRAYCMFATNFEALEANFFQREKILQFLGRRLTDNEPNLVPEEFVAEKNVNNCKDVSASEGANVDDKTVKMSDLPLPPQEEEHSKVI
jgi:hypothetical protein